LRTKDREEAEQIAGDKKEALKNPNLNHKIGLAYYSDSDQDMYERT
jgi:hypothetical protein